MVKKENTEKPAGWVLWAWNSLKICIKGSTNQTQQLRQIFLLLTKSFNCKAAFLCFNLENLPFLELGTSC
jgi:hypothetical protein